MKSEYFELLLWKVTKGLAVHYDSQVHISVLVAEKDEGRVLEKWLQCDESMPGGQ